MSKKDLLKISDKKFKSRLMIGTGRHRSNDEMVNSIKAAGAEIITVAIRRLDLNFLSLILSKSFFDIKFLLIN
jgi:thiazole synthase